MKIYKQRKVNAKDAAESFEASYKESPNHWSDFQIKQLAHIIKWASVSFNIREAVKLSKSLLVRELGQRGYVKHIHTVFPIEQGHNLGYGKITKYDYRGILKNIVKSMISLGYQDEFMILFKAVMADIESTFRKRMGWFYKMVQSWFGTYVDQLKQILKSKHVTTIQESYNYSNTSRVEFVMRGEAETSASQTRAEKYFTSLHKPLCKMFEELGFVPSSSYVASSLAV